MKKTFLLFTTALMLCVTSTFAQPGAGTLVIGIQGVNTGTINGLNYNVNNTTRYLNEVIVFASQYSPNFKHFRINSGTYLVNGTINLDGTNNLKSIVIEGSEGTIISRAPGFTGPIFSLSTERNIIQNLKIINNESTVIKINDKAQRNIIENIVIENTVVSNEPQIFIDLTNGGEADHNSFNKITMTNCKNGISIDGSGVFNHNTFNEITFNNFEVAIDFSNSTNAKLEGNVFTNIHANASANSLCIIKGIRGANNSFQNIEYNNWPSIERKVITVVPSDLMDSQRTERNVIKNVTGDFATGIVTTPTTTMIENPLQTTTGAVYRTGTVIENSTNSDDSTNYIYNNTMYALYNATGITGFNTRFSIKDFNDIQIKPRNNTIETGYVLTAKDESGNVEWKPASATSNQITSVSNTLSGTMLTTTLNSGSTSPIVSNQVELTGLANTTASLFTENGWLRNTTLANNYTRTVTMKDNSTGINSNLKFTRDGIDNWAVSDVMMLYTDKTGGNDANCVVIGANTWANANANANATIKYKLLVNGRIKAKDEVTITDTGWADYVFAKDYRLKPLSEVAEYINENGHLPNMPSATEIENNGMPLANITIKQQEKIEELTLYAIEQDKKLNARQTQLETQQKEVEALQKLVNQLINKAK